MISWLNRCFLRRGRLIPVALVVATVGLLIATVLLFRAESHNRELLARSIRTSGWVAYQAQLEFVKAHASIEIAIAAPSQRNLDDAALRLEILLSRLPILYNSEEGKLLQGIDEFTPLIKQYEGQIEDIVNALPEMNPSDPSVVATLTVAHDTIEPLGKELQTILQTSVAYNDELYQREAELSRNPAVIPLLLMLLSGGGLVLVLLLQGARDRARLNEVNAAKAREAAMRNNFRAAIEAMPAVIVIFDPAATAISFANPAALALIGESEASAERVRLLELMIEHAKADPSEVMSITLPRDDGRITSLRGACRFVVWEGRQQVLFALADTTQIRAAELQVMQSAKLATLGEMASAIAHELNQPLAVIKMASTNARRLLDNNAPAETITAKLERIEGQIDRAKRITDQVRRYARAPSAVETTFPLRLAIELAAGFVSEQLRAAGIRLDLDIQLSFELVAIGEQTMFEQTIVNLLVNARDAFDGKAEMSSEKKVRLTAQVSGEEIVVIVGDNAGGIAPHVLPHLFEPFTTTKTAEKGTGLGLSLARTVVSSMHGTISAANVDGGASFTIRLPLAAGQAARRDVA